jgi:hypothetical protein
LIDNVLASAISAPLAKSGYFFSFSTVPTPGGISTSYKLTATPANPGTTGQRYFYTDQSGVIRYGANSVADISSSPIQ